MSAHDVSECGAACVSLAAEEAYFFHAPFGEDMVSLSDNWQKGLALPSIDTAAVTLLLISACGFQARRHEERHGIIPRRDEHRTGELPGRLPTR